MGFGLAGCAYALQLKRHQKSFVIFNDKTTNASTIAAGIINPVVLKRYTQVWKAAAFLEYAQAFYQHFEKEYKVNVFAPATIKRFFSSMGEQNQWSEASRKGWIESYLEPEIHMTTPPNIYNPNGYGQVKNSFRLDIQKMQSTFKQTLNKEHFFETPFDYAALKIEENNVIYKDIKAVNVVFCEGFGLTENPFFNYLPIIGNKGEALIIKAPDLKEQGVLKARGIFIVPLKKDYFWVGATFNWDDKTTTTTAKGRTWLEYQLNTVIKVPYEVIKQVAGMRPTVVDRRPLLGQHPVDKSLYVFNGLGTRGALMAPLLSEELFHFITAKKTLPAACTIERFRNQDTTERHID